MIAVVDQRIKSRPFQSEEDFWRVRNLLIETYPITPFGFNWEIRRWDGWRFHRTNSAVKPEWSELIRLWETEDGQLVGVAHPEGRGDLFLEVHPDYREIEEEMFAWGERNLDVYDEQRRQLETFVYDRDSSRRRLLKARGYQEMSYGGVMRRLDLAHQPLPSVVLADGYTLRSTRAEEDDYQRMAELLNAAFNRTIHTASEYHTFSAQSPSFRHLTNLVAEAPDGSFAAHVGVTYDVANRFAIVEPVCTHPDHRRKGLARALMIEGLQRVKGLGAAVAGVGTGDGDPANQLYEAVGFGEAYWGHTWRKVW